MRYFYRIIIIVAILFAPLSKVYSLEKETHFELNGVATKHSNIDTKLKEIGFSGIGQTVNDKKIEDWIKLGGKTEDEPIYTRSRNHFHNPLLPSDQAGLNSGIFTGKSSTLWIQDQSNRRITDLGGDWSWNTARKFYHAALTGDSTALNGFKVEESLFNSTTIAGKINMNETERNQFFVWTFRAAGQLIHLIEDASVPAHTRNDAHIFYNYENWVENNPIAVTTAASNSTFFNGTISSISSFIDTDQYTGSSPPSGTSIGLSEYTNANFFSEDTINASNFPYPDITKTTVTEKTAPSGNYQRQYYLKNCCGETKGNQGYLLSAVDYLDYYRLQYPSLSFALPKIPVLDDNVYQDYASLLLPRAVGYSAGLLNYFFRGQITMEKDPNNSSQYVIKNESDEYMSGTFTLYYDDVSGNRKYLISWNKSINAKSSSDSVSFTAPTDAEEKGKYILVFQGTLGNETSAVVGKMVKIEECIKPEEVEIIYENGVLQMKDCEGKWKPIYTIGCIPSGEYTQATKKIDSTSFFVVTNWYQEYRMYTVEVTSEIENRNGLLFRKLRCSLFGKYVGSSDTWTQEYSSDITSSGGYGLVDITISGISTSNSTGSISYNVAKKTNGEWAFVQTTKGSSSSTSYSTSVLKTPVLDAPQSWYDKTLKWYYPGDGYGESAKSCLYETPVRCYFRIDGLGEFYSAILGSPSASETKTSSQMIGGSTSVDLFTGETVSYEAPRETSSCQYRKAGEAKPPLHNNFGSYVPNDITSETFCDWTTCPPSTVWTSIPGYIGGAVYWDYSRYLKLLEEDKKRITIQYYGRIISSMMRVPWQNCQ